MEVLIVYGGGGALMLLLGVFFYVRSVESRAEYRCSQCGERQKTELMTASRCNHCGAPLHRI